MLSLVDLSVGTDHELVRLVRDTDAGLTGVIALHSTALGPAMGGVRRLGYSSVDDAIADVLKLSAVMTLKNSVAGLPLGGGKSVIIDHAPEPSGAMLDAFAEAIEQLDGRYIAAEDIGTKPAHMDRIARHTAWVAGQSPAAGGTGDPSPTTAGTVFQSMKAAATLRWGCDDLSGRTIGVLGVGKVGSRLAEMAREAEAQLVLADLNSQRSMTVASRLDAEAVTPEALIQRSLDILAPCARGSLLTPANSRSLPVEIVCGAANNILSSDDVADHLASSGILYVPDFLANAGGIIHVGGGFLGWDAATIGKCVELAVRRVADVLRESHDRGVPPLTVARERAHARLVPSRATAAS